MTVSELTNAGFTPVVLPDPEREISGAYAGDLLSWVMGRATSGNAWITIMTNINIVAVAALVDISCIILSEGVTASPDVIQTANAKNINVLSTGLPTYEAALALAKAIS